MQCARRTRRAKLSSIAITIDSRADQTRQTLTERSATRKASVSRRCIRCATSRVSRDASFMSRARRELTAFFGFVGGRPQDFGHAPRSTPSSHVHVRHTERVVRFPILDRSQRVFLLRPQQLHDESHGRVRVKLDRVPMRASRVRLYPRSHALWRRRQCRHFRVPDRGDQGSWKVHDENGRAESIRGARHESTHQ